MKLLARNKNYCFQLTRQKIILEIIKSREVRGEDHYTFDNSSEAIEEYEKMKGKHGKNNIEIYKNDEVISFEILRKEEISISIDEDERLKSGYRPGYRSNRDISKGADGDTKNVWKPKNPESDFDLNERFGHL